MSEEVTYADIKFQDSGQTKDAPKFDNLERKATPAPSHVWRQTALALTLLCLLLLIGLGVLGSMFYITSKAEMEKSNKLQSIKEELERNVSLQLVSNMNISKKIMNLSTTMQEIATKLCYELYRRQTEHKCKPCPEKWKWHENNCFGLLDEQLTWQESEKLCSAENASLLKIKNQSILEFVKSQYLYGYWLGLSPRKDPTHYENLDETIISANWYIRNTDDLNNKIWCGYIEKPYIYYGYCTSRKKPICEKLANPVKIEDALMI
ncbi:C-type lectin domain family 12 member A [Choloepus didactylus]|uniref:C-type lectin domain family 12 member A n=1 Tax=Choloepus didactylus TaxID=27675 RepID=UPI00189CBEAE|nr:C-type lectin domain family 12 member A [Choloepus didactylus]